MTRDFFISQSAELDLGGDPEEHWKIVKNEEKFVVTLLVAG